MNPEAQITIQFPSVVIVLNSTFFGTASSTASDLSRMFSTIDRIFAMRELHKKNPIFLLHHQKQMLAEYSKRLEKTILGFCTRIT